MPYVYESPNTNHKVVDEKGRPLAAFNPDPEDTPENRAKGKFPVRGVFTTDDKALAQKLEGLGKHGIARAAGGEDPAKGADDKGK